MISANGKRNLPQEMTLEVPIIKRVIEFLDENPVQYLATVARDGTAKCCPFMFAGELDGRLWFCTNNQKEVYRDILADPGVEFSVSGSSYVWLRLHGKAVFENNREAKELRMPNPIVKGQYGNVGAPMVEVFYLDDPHGVIADFSGNPPYVF